MLIECCVFDSRCWAMFISKTQRYLSKLKLVTFRTRDEVFYCSSSYGIPANIKETMLRYYYLSCLYRETKREMFLVTRTATFVEMSLVSYYRSYQYYNKLDPTSSTLSKLFLQVIFATFSQWFTLYTANHLSLEYNRFAVAINASVSLLRSCWAVE